jgi:DNA-binding response OmpR family regulator
LEDDPHQAAWIEGVLTGAGHRARLFAAGRAILAELARETYDMLLLDWEVPDGSGLEVLRRLRADQNRSVPVLFLTHRDSEEDIVLALESGADDYLVKPPRERELLARVAALARRGGAELGGDKYELPPYAFDSATRTVTLRGRRIELTAREFDLALFLFKRLGAVVSRAHVLESVWGRGANTTTRTVDTHVSRLRTALAIGPENGVRLVPVYGYGYRLEAVGGNG